MEQNQHLKSLTLREFTSLTLRPYITHVDDIYKDFTTYKTSVPVTGAIILDESYQRATQEVDRGTQSSWAPKARKPSSRYPSCPTIWKVKNMASGASGVPISPSQASPLLPASILRPSTPSAPISSTAAPEGTQTPVTSPPEEPPALWGAGEVKWGVMATRYCS